MHSLVAAAVAIPCCCCPYFVWQFLYLCVIQCEHRREHYIKLARFFRMPPIVSAMAMWLRAHFVLLRFSPHVPFSCPVFLIDCVNSIVLAG